MDCVDLKQAHHHKFTFYLSRHKIYFFWVFDFLSQKKTGLEEPKRKRQAESDLQ